MRPTKPINVIVILLSLTIFAAATLGVNTKSAHGDEGVFKQLIQSSTWILTPDGRGSGVLIDGVNRLVVTNAHVVGKHSSAIVIFPEFRNGKLIHETKYYLENVKQLGIKATVVAKDVARDVAVLKLSSLPSGVEAIELGESAQAGQAVHSIGNPSASGAKWIYSGGKVRANNYSTFRSGGKMRQFQKLETYIPTSAGVSGGPIADSDSRLVGINQGHRNNVDSFSYGVDISEIKYVLKKHRLMVLPTRSVAENESLKRAPTISQEKVVGNSLADLSYFKTDQ